MHSQIIPYIIMMIYYRIMRNKKKVDFEKPWIDVQENEMNRKERTLYIATQIFFEELFVYVSPLEEELI